MKNLAGRVLTMVNGRRMPIISPKVDPKTLVGKKLNCCKNLEEFVYNLFMRFGFYIGNLV
jgi:hypothetical protein